MEPPKKLCLKVIVAFILLVLLYTYLPTLPTNYNSSKHHFQFDIHRWPHGESCAENDERDACKNCMQKWELWDCVGEDRKWSLVFVDNRPWQKRDQNFLRMITRAEVVVCHDTSHDLTWPSWHKGAESNQSHWAGRRHFTHTFEQHTSVIQGDMDINGSVFDRVVSIFNSGKTIPYVKEFNPTDHGHGTHIQLLAAAALATEGDILEMGTGLFSTTLLHQIVQEQGASRMIVSTDTGSFWLSLFRNISTPFHQFVLVPVYEDGEVCGEERLPAKPLKEMEFLGSITKQLTTNRDIVCP